MPDNQSAPLFIPPLLLRTSGWTGRGIGFLLGGLSVLGQAPLHFWPLTLFCLALLFIRLQRASSAPSPRRAGFSVAFWFALGYFGVGVFWIGSAFIARGPEFIPVMPPMILALASALSVFWGVAGLIFSSARLKPIWAQFGFISLFSLAELARGYAFGGFPWNLTGYIFPGGGAFSQGAAIWTIYGQSCFVFALSAALASGLIFKNITARLMAGFIFILGLGSVYGFGAARLAKAEIVPQEGIVLRIVSVPFNQADKFDPDKSIAIVNQFLEESLKDDPADLAKTAAPFPEVTNEGRLKDVTHIIWPEGAVVGLAMENAALLYAMGRELAYAFEGEDLPVWLINSLRLQERINPKTQSVVKDYFNSSVAVTFDRGGVPSIAAFNDKARLVPFGEFIPFGKWMESKNVPVISTNLLSISAAKTKTLAKFPGLPIGSPQICYEIIFPAFTPRPQKEASAQFILNQSNDAWFGNSWGPAQHANIARYRAIEEAIPIIRSASNGVSGIFDPYGRVMIETNLKKSSHIDTILPKPLKKARNSSHMIALLFLINLFLSLLCVGLGRGLNSRVIN